MGIFSIFKKETKFESYKHELENYEQIFNNPLFSKFKSDILDHLKTIDLKELNKENQPWEDFVLFSIVNVSGDHLETGDYHMYRGVLNPDKDGPNYLKIFNTGLDLLVEKGLVSENEAKMNRKGLQDNISNIG